VSPDTPETRIGRLESTVAALNQHVQDLDSRVAHLQPLVVGVAELKVGLADVKADVHEASNEVAALRVSLDERERKRAADARERRDQERRDARNNRWVLISGLVFVVLTFIGTVVVQLLVANGGAP
jgi:t-SNARE complex subunit (syntaxin)